MLRACFVTFVVKFAFSSLVAALPCCVLRGQNYLFLFSCGFTALKGARRKLDILPTLKY